MIYNLHIEQDAGKTPYDRIASEYDYLFGEHNPYYESLSRREWEIFEDSVPRPRGAQLALDVGCGTGFHTKWLTDRGFDAVGIDQSKGMIHVAQAKSLTWQRRSEFKVMDVNDLEQMPEGVLAVVLCLGSVLNHLDDWRTFAKLVSRRLADGGLFLFSYDNIDGIDVIARALLRQFAGYSDAYIREVLYGRIKARLVGKTFKNHWRVYATGGQVEVPLQYEH